MVVAVAGRRIERRYVGRQSADVRLLRDQGGEVKRLRGYAARFYDGTPGTQYVKGLKVERLAPCAFDRALAERHGVIACVNHNADRVLGRTADGTLRLSVDALGLVYEVDLRDTWLSHDTVRAVEWGKLSGGSFRFQERARSVSREDGRTIWTITDLDLYDVGPVDRGAYRAATCWIAGCGASVDRPRVELSSRDAMLLQINVRLRILELDEEEAARRHGRATW